MPWRETASCHYHSSSLADTSHSGGMMTIHAITRGLVGTHPTQEVLERCSEVTHNAVALDRLMDYRLTHTFSWLLSFVSRLKSRP